MESRSAFDKRESAFEAGYFAKKDSEMVDKLKQVFHKKVDKESIRKATGVTDEAILDRLVALNLSGELMAAFQLYPLIEVAWADGKLDDDEGKAVLRAAEKVGIARGSRAYQFLEDRLKTPPKEDNRKVWFLYAEQLKKVLSPTELATFRKDLSELAQRVAEATGGLLSFSRVSANEKKVLDAINKALSA